MEGTEIDLIQMLDCRERRGFIQNDRRSGRPFLRAWLR